MRAALNRWIHRLCHWAWIELRVVDSALALRMLRPTSFYSTLQTECCPERLLAKVRLRDGLKLKTEGEPSPGEPVVKPPADQKTTS